MTDRISLRGMRVDACHGVLPEEKTAPQPFLVDIDMEVDLSWAGHSDRLADTVSYAEVAHRAVAVVAGAPVDLIEHLAEQVAEEVLASPLMEATTVTVHKPQAPVGVPFGDVSVSVRRERQAEVVVALGANLSSPQERLADAIRRIGDLPGVDLLRVSPLWRTDPVGGPAGQPTYLNAVAVLRTRSAPRTVLSWLHEIEAVHGRQRAVRWGARTLDLDLIQYVDPRQGGQVRSDDPELMLPHPRAWERAFVMVPWSVADPSHEAVAQAVAGLDVSGVRPGPAWPQSVAASVMVMAAPEAMS
ncbi:Bifunctional folate synthesis protein [Austwickia sp. TVS 96-490-7B]|uniref:dihydroneopterin aldolase n=1 Tax=Austwickia sp. TVS 96-490-7B TaxID=2830843 RepID=UPI001C568057|nr:dihydroneopterin aldolase [Austwickia sp. TVS 96-490-7B]MBW3084830.1 Bifunctional folate synthesis protein [Austwickia sp. TVS 96-490-7B]